MFTKNHFIALGMFALLLVPVAAHADGVQIDVALSRNVSELNIPFEKKVELQQVCNNFQNNSQGLRDDLYDKKLELDQLSKNPNANQMQIKQVKKEMKDLRSTLRAQRDGVAAEIKNNYKVDPKVCLGKGRE